MGDGGGGAKRKWNGSEEPEQQPRPFLAPNSFSLYGVPFSLRLFLFSCQII